MVSNYTLGVDETGWGSFAGPLVVAGVIVPDDLEISSLIKDSKKFSSDALRRKAYEDIVNNYPYFYEFVYPGDVKTAIYSDSEPLYPDWGTALRSATKIVIAYLTDSNTNGTFRYIIDGNSTYNIPGLIAIPKADATVPAVAAASIVAKVLHDEYMINLQKLCGVPYGLENNKGYGTKAHKEAIQKYGPIKGIHRMNIDFNQKALEEVGWSDVRI